MTTDSDTRNWRRPVARIAGALACAALLIAGASSDTLAEKRKPRDELPPGHFYTMKPFTIPMMKDGVVTDHFTLVVALELADPDMRSRVFHLSPRLRHAMYQRLYQMVTFRRKGSALPPIDIFKRNLSKIVLELASTKLVASLLIQQAFKRHLRD